METDNNTDFPKQYKDLRKVRLDKTYRKTLASH
jgi:hypothetical protein